MTTTPLRIGICHYRIGKTDGVSLEITKQQRVLTEMGHSVKTIAGIRQTGADYIIPELEYDRIDLIKIKENAFAQLINYQNGDELMENIDELAAKIEHQFLRIQEQEKFDYLFLHNIFSFGLNLPATKAFYNIAANGICHIIGVHHDFYWDGPNAYLYQPTCDEVQQFVDTYLPPQLPRLQHVVINSLNAQKLLNKYNINPILIPDTFDFNQPTWKPDDYNKTLLDDLGINDDDIVVLHATRIVERKAVELAIHFVQELNEQREKLVGQTLYNGKKITKNSRVILVLIGYTEEHTREYRQRLENEITRTGIEARFADHLIDTERSEKESTKIYSLWDSYVYADLVTYTSLWEGWGNQFIEAVFAKRPIVIFEYPVYQSDIKPEGYQVISLGETLSDDLPSRLVQVPDNHNKGAVAQTINQLTSPQTNTYLNTNFQIGLKYHGDEVLKELLQKTLN